jgi:hypothetical protein
MKFSNFFLGKVRDLFSNKSLFRCAIFFAIILGSFFACPSFGGIFGAGKVFASDLVPAIEIQPSNNVEVGEEVYFSATGTTYKGNHNSDTNADAVLLQKARYEWDFGDGFAFKFKSLYYYTLCSGVAATHYFMKPGNFTVTLTVTIWSDWDANGNPIGNPITTENITTVMHVTGEAPMTGFEIQHANFNNRLAQYLYVQVPAAYRNNQATLKVTLEGAKGYNQTLLSKNNPSSEEKILLDQKNLVQDDYVVVAKLLDNSNNQIPGGIWRDKFSKPYDGIPKVGIDENNSFRVNGELFFPVGPFMEREDGIKSFLDQTDINMLHTEGYYDSHAPSTWSTYLNAAQTNGLLSIGPARGNYEINYSLAPANRWKFNHNPDRMAQYIQTNKNSPAMFAWSWQDEPNLGGWSQFVYPPTLAAWGNIAHRGDPQHPTFNLFYGYGYSKYYGTAPSLYDYLSSDNAKFFGGKRWVQDAIPFDVYPMNARLHPSLNMVDMGPYSAYLDLLDRIGANNKSLVPIMPAIQPCKEQATGPEHTEEQVYSEAWMNVIHGAKSIIWFPAFDYSSIRWAAMKKFDDQIKVLAPVVLGPEPTRTATDNSNAALNRVDTMIRENNGSIYLFSARVTEPDPITGAKYTGVEPDSIITNFTISGLTGTNTVEVVDENRFLNSVNGQFTDTFDKNAVHIYKIGSGVAADLTPPAAPSGLTVE